MYRGPQRDAQMQAPQGPNTGNQGGAYNMSAMMNRLSGVMPGGGGLPSTGAPAPSNAGLDAAPTLFDLQRQRAAELAANTGPQPAPGDPGYIPRLGDDHRASQPTDPYNQEKDPVKPGMGSWGAQGSKPGMGFGNNMLMQHLQELLKGPGTGGQQGGPQPFDFREHNSGSQAPQPPQNQSLQDLARPAAGRPEDQSQRYNGAPRYTPPTVDRDGNVTNSQILDYNLPQSWNRDQRPRLDNPMDPMAYLRSLFGPRGP